MHKIGETLFLKYSNACPVRDEFYTDAKGTVRTCQVTDYTNLKQIDQYDMYGSLGHDTAPQNLLWLYQGGKLLTHPSGEDVYHHTVWSPDSFKTNFRGRVTEENGQTIVTLFRPLQYDKDTEDKVLRKLMIEFSPADVKVFG